MLAGPLLFCGCAGFLASEGADRIRGLEALKVDARVCAIEPASDVTRRLPGAGYSTIYANGLAWIGLNVATAQGGDLSVLDNGEGRAFGVAFGDGENLKRFFEIGS